MLQSDYLDRYPDCADRAGADAPDGGARPAAAVGPAATLERGYAVVLDDQGRVVRDSADTAAGRQIAVRLSRGRLAARVEEVSE